MYILSITKICQSKTSILRYVLYFPVNRKNPTLGIHFEMNNLNSLHILERATKLN